MNPEESAGPVSYNTSPGRGKSILVPAVLIILLIASLAFGGWAFSQMSTFKNDSDKKSAAAVAAAKNAQAAQLQAQFDEQSKSPNKTYKGSATYGSVTFDYPKTWSAYIETNNTSEPINGYFNPDVVPGLQSKTALALRVELLASDYSQVLQQYNSSFSQAKLTAKAYMPPKMQNVANVSAGTYLSGPINSADPTQSGAMVIIRVRDKTLKIYTESNQYLTDFTGVLNSLTFAP